MARSTTRPSLNRVDTGNCDLASVTDWTCGTWVYYDGSGTDEHTVCSNWSALSSRATILFRIEPATDTVELFVVDSAGQKSIAATDLTITTNVWTFVGARFEGGTVTNVFVGESKSSNTSTPAATMATTNSDNAWYFGNTPHNTDVAVGTDAFGGRFAEGFIAVGELYSDEEMAAIARGAIRLGRFTNAESRYNQIYGNLSPESDSSGNGHTGALTGTARENHAPVELVENYL